MIIDYPAITGPMVRKKLIESSFLLDVKKLEVIVAQQNYIQLKEIVMIIIASTYTSNKTILSG